MTEHTEFDGQCPELKSARKFALKSSKWQKCIGDNDTYYNPEEPNDFIEPETITHIFMHSLIKEMEQPNIEKFTRELRRVLNTGWALHTHELGWTMVTASVDNLLLAFHKTFKENL